jgi:hypothetical protein
VSWTLPYPNVHSDRWFQPTGQGYVNKYTLNELDMIDYMQISGVILGKHQVALAAIQSRQTPNPQAKNVQT